MHKVTLVTAVLESSTCACFFKFKSKFWQLWRVPRSRGTCGVGFWLYASIRHRCFQDFHARPREKKQTEQLPLWHSAQKPRPAVRTLPNKKVKSFCNSWRDRSSACAWKTIGKTISAPLYWFEEGCCFWHASCSPWSGHCLELESRLR